MDQIVDVILFLLETWFGLFALLMIFIMMLYFYEIGELGLKTVGGIMTTITGWTILVGLVFTGIILLIR